jgi:hypothetical protein
VQEANADFAAAAAAAPSLSSSFNTVLADGMQDPMVSHPFIS